MRKMDAATRKWLASQYGQEIDAQRHERLRVGFAANTVRVNESNGVRVEQRRLVSGSTLTKHVGMWETLYFVDPTGRLDDVKAAG